MKLNKSHIISSTDGHFFRNRVINAWNCLYRQHFARSASRRYLIYSEADFEVFRPIGATRCADGGEIWHGGGDRAKFHPNRCNDKGVGPPKLKFLLRYDQNVKYKRPAGAYPLRDFFTTCTVFISHFRMR